MWLQSKNPQAEPANSSAIAHNSGFSGKSQPAVQLLPKMQDGKQNEASSERHLPHQAWHVIQHKQRRVQSTVQLKNGVDPDDDAVLEKKADIMGAKASQMKVGPHTPHPAPVNAAVSQLMPVQLTRDELEYGYYGRDGKKKSQKVVRMEEFGDRNRIHNLDPNKLGEELEEDIPEMGIKKENVEGGEKGDIDKALGIWRPSKAEGTARPEDPPIYQPFRKAFHETHNVMLSLKLAAEDTLDTGSYQRELLRIGHSVKKSSLDYKAKVRNFNNETTIAALKKEYFGQLDELKELVLALGIRMIKEYKATSPVLNNIEDDTLKGVKSKHGEEVWKKEWWAVVQHVNHILSTKWSVGKAAIKQWVAEKSDVLPYMDQNMIGDLDYIGSLAKGYKSAPKQYLRFLPENFDVDAKLDAPPLAVYAISQGEPVDRGSVKHGEKITPLRKFEESAWSELKNIPGIDQEDIFEVFIRADNVTDLIYAMHPDIKAAQKEESFSLRLQNIQNRIWWLKSKDIRYQKTIKERMPNYINDEGKLKDRETGIHEKASTKKYLEPDLSFMETQLTKLESLVRPAIYSSNGRKMKQAVELADRIDQVRSEEIIRFWESPVLLIAQLKEALEVVNDTPPLELLNWDFIELAGPNTIIHPIKNPYVLDMARSFTRASIGSTLRWLQSE